MVFIIIILILYVYEPAWCRRNEIEIKNIKNHKPLVLLKYSLSLSHSLKKIAY